MKTTHFLPGALAALSLLLLPATRTTAADPVLYKAKYPSQVKIAGTSTVHDWEVEGKIIGGAMQLPADFPLDPQVAQLPARLSAQPRVQAMIPVRSIKSGKSTMDAVMQDTFKQDKHPNITYKVTELKPSQAARKAGDPLQFDTTGELTVAGVTKTIQMPVSFTPVGDNQIKITGAVKVKMTDYGMSPPAPKIGLGLITTSDDVSIRFDWLTEKQ